MTIAERLFDIFGLKKDSPEPNGDEKTRWKIEEQFGPKSHPQTVIQQLAPMVCETVQVVEKYSVANTHISVYCVDSQSLVICLLSNLPISI